MVGKGEGMGVEGPKEGERLGIKGRVKCGKRMGRMCGRIRETCHIYDILYSINLPIQM